MTGRVTVLGSGTSMGVPFIGCRCRVCLSNDEHDKRTRPSLLIEYGGRNIVIDTTPDFRFQALRAGMERLDAVLFTHPHADHILGLDDVRPFNFRQKQAIAIYGSRRTIDRIRHTFDYIFDSNYPFGGLPEVSPHVIEGPVELFGARFIPVPVMHGRMEVYGFRFGNVAYLTDYGEIPERSFALLDGLEVVFLDALRHEPHPTHCTVEQAVRHAGRIGARRTFLTHIAHDLSHGETNAKLPEHVRLCYDGLRVEVEL